MTRGVLIASDRKQEIFIPWWYSHFSQHNDLPIAVIDLGLSSKGRRHAEYVGQCIDYTDCAISLCVPTHYDPETKGVERHVQDAHTAWTKKPFACALSPFDQTIWIDLDCEVRCDVSVLFDYLDNSAGFGCSCDHPIYEKWCQEKAILGAAVKGYDSAVIAYTKHSPVLDAWKQATLDWSGPFWGDDRILSHVVAHYPFAISEIPPIYNSNPWKSDPNAKILHWATPHGKAEIVRQMLLNLV